MADLQQVVGAILRDLAKARFGSDIFSRSISRYYEQSDLLRRFPVPRTEIDEVEIELRFGIAQIADDVAHTEGREATMAVLLERHIERIVAHFTKVALDPIRRDSVLSESLARSMASARARIDLRQQIMRYFVEDHLRLINDDGSFEVDDALPGIRLRLRWAIIDQAREDADLDAVRDAARRVVEQIDIRPPLEALKEPLQAVWQASRDGKIEIVVTPESLSTLPENAISSLKIKASVRNYNWTEVKNPEGGRDWRALTSE